MENNIELNKMSREPLENYAVCVRHAFKHYGSKHPLQVLQDFNMTVPKGIIYGLLGASGCGKTTLLNCMIGRSSLDSGVIKVLGAEEPPGPRIGFMPQNIALYNEFSIEESMTYFGWIAGMSTEEIKERLNFLGALLHLPEVDKKIKNLSGGQQRRVSLATALLHEPELLILDEPTVGLDPLLRETIWEHLLQITSKRGTTVILTTHYIDETRDAHQIGLMRGGRLLAEESPEDLLFYLNTSSLEEVFFILSAQQSENGLLPIFEKHRSFGKPYSDLDFIDSEDENPKNDHKQEKTKLSTKCRRASGANHMKALIWKNFLWMLKNYPMMISMILLPTLTVLAFCICFGHKPRGLDVAVWNLETNNTKCTNLTCDSPLLSCQYLDYVERARLINLHYSGSLEEAQKSVLHGKTHAALWVSQNYTAALKKRIHKGYRTKTWDILHSTVNVYKDNAVKDVGEFIKGHLYERFQAFLGDYFEACEGSRRLVDLPIKWEEPIYGDPKLDFTEFGSSGVILSLVFFSAAALSGTSMMIERNEGILERSLVMGMSPIKILFAHFACEIGVMGLQCISILLVGFGFYGLTLKGSIFLVLFLTFLTGLGGMCAGFVISCAFSSEAAATHVLLGSFMPLIFISGLVWPLEGMHPILQVMAIGIPFTQISESMRSILHRGWGIDKPIVYLGFLSISGWSLIFLAISIVCLKYRKN